MIYTSKRDFANLNPLVAEHQQSAEQLSKATSCYSNFKYLILKTDGLAKIRDRVQQGRSHGHGGDDVYYAYKAIESLVSSDLCKDNFADCKKVEQELMDLIDRLPLKKQSK